jgi:hypothetical protein
LRISPAIGVTSGQVVQMLIGTQPNAPEDPLARVFEPLPLCRIQRARTAATFVVALELSIDAMGGAAEETRAGRACVAGYSSLAGALEIVGGASLRVGKHGVRRVEPRDLAAAGAVAQRLAHKRLIIRVNHRRGRVRPNLQDFVIIERAHNPLTLAKAARRAAAAVTGIAC